ncbi:GYDIA family GHMP kinase [Pseudotamlana carrageenivorans]|uniref:GHMP kinase n=1 Tax=Pseudotamlana carrageenivorans TaxID=2069432 RepID=A0A2I7SJ42_9FLAO|nr:GYDIA family GHMP kinase [Tamlana carrageenivorans]AUS05922.1 GHMP kinase [Tamlana carrageenivorans]
MFDSKTIYSNGKLLISGEYVVLDGAVSLAVPTKFGQFLNIIPIGEKRLVWTSLDEKSEVWFEGVFDIDLFSSEVDCEISQRITQILKAAKDLNPSFLASTEGFHVSTKLDFPRNWGLGTSSTLINNIAEWAGVDAFQLLEKTFGGSGYDIACAQNNSAITYQLENNTPFVLPVEFNPSFKNNLYFVHLNKKQNSREGIKQYNETKVQSNFSVEEMNAITSEMISSDSLEDFKALIVHHENYISKITKQTPVKDLYFEDFEGAIKSLGAWGGDFILVASDENPTSYFKAKGFHTIIPYRNMVL